MSAVVLAFKAPPKPAKVGAGEPEPLPEWLARKVADASGGFLGLTSRISAAQFALISELSTAFHP